MPRKEKEYKYHFIYKTSNIKNGKFYIGMHSTNDLNDSYLGSGNRLRSSIRHHGRENHVREILEFFPDRSSLDRREREIVNENLLKDPLCLNLVVGGDGGFPLSAEHIKRFSQCGNKAFLERFNNDNDLQEKFKKESSERLRKTHGEGKIKIKDWAGKKHKEESKRSIGIKNSERQKGDRNSQYGKYWITNEIEDKKIVLEDLERYISLGWRKGRNSKCNKK